MPVSKQPNPNVIMVDDQKSPFCRFSQIQSANRVLQSLGSQSRIGNLMNPALRQSMWDTSNLDRLDQDDS